ncbi:cell wall hydrolase [Croceibacterium ferulae]|uniref:cell wall hydrolase n=1 Tax=Croceibacterium ferulae TaxID=1854641 RepID=UPI000EAFCB6A|nr:cell wall hydrolase [Croceibacterium ferulae]
MAFTSARVRVTALALTFFCTLFGAAGSGAFAQDDLGPNLGQVAAPVAVTPPPPPAADIEAPAPRFIAEPVIQQMPEQPEADTLAELVAVVPEEADLTDELKCLAQAIYWEARGEDLDGQLAVAQVIINRTENHRFPANYCGVVTQRSQFSFVRGGRIPDVRTGTRAWHRAKAIARIAHDDLWDSEVGDALYFHARRVRPSWSHTKLARATIDSHIFYR